MKKYVICCLMLFAIILSPLTYCFADDSEEDHVCFKQVDTDKNGIASFKEFEKFYGDDLEKYKKMDIDEDGKLTHDEYEEYLYNEE